MKSNRREFVQATMALGAAGLVAGKVNSTWAAEHSGSGHLVEAGNTVLFQGDSITDAGRDRETAATPNQQKPLGNRYAWLAAASMLVDRPEDDLKILNRGISGDTVPKLVARWQADCLDLRPDVLSILVGVNDIWHRFKGKEGVPVELFESGYHTLLERTRAALPEVKLVICEPFVLQCGAVTDEWFPAFDGYRAAVRRVSDAAGARYVPFQTMFDRAIEHAPPEHWAADGVHPTAAGAALMAHTWLQAVGTA